METVLGIFHDGGLILYFAAIIIWGFNTLYRQKKGVTPMYRKIRFANLILLCLDFIVVITYGVLAAIFQ